jgi:hypothetical protein
LRLARAPRRRTRIEKKRVPYWREVDANDVARGIRPTHHDHIIAGQLESPSGAGDWVVVLY